MPRASHTDQSGNALIMALFRSLQFSALKPLRGSGMLHVRGNVWIKAGSPSFFSGMLDGNPTVEGPAEIQGAVVLGLDPAVRPRGEAPDSSRGDRTGGTGFPDGAWLRSAAMTECPSHPELHRLIDVVAKLRAPGGCPWDREQSETSMAPHLLEEAFEAVDALQDGDPAGSAEELGDVLMNVLMLCEIAHERGRYDLERVARGIADKLVRRHPHVFGEAEASDAEQVLRTWEAIKRREGGAERPRSVLAGVPAALPALMRAHRVGQKAARVGFDWPDAAGPRGKLAEELEELDRALSQGGRDAVERELGDVLFSVCNVARHAGVDPEMALRRTVDRFVRRFRHLEERLAGRLESAGLEEMEALWQQAKRAETE